MLESVENAITEMPRVRVSCAVAGTEPANSGPRMISLPSSSACWVACCAPCGVRAVILDQELDVGILEFGQRHLGRVLHRLRGDAGVAGGRERQQHPDLDLPGADRERLLRRSGRSGVLGRSERVLRAGARAKQGRAENEADRRPPGRSRQPRIRRSRLAIERAYHRLSSLDRPPSARTSSHSGTKAPEPLLNPMPDLAHCREIVN